MLLIAYVSLGYLSMISSKNSTNLNHFLFICTLLHEALAVLTWLDDVILLRYFISCLLFLVSLCKGCGYFRDLFLAKRQSRVD